MLPLDLQIRGDQKAGLVEPRKEVDPTQKKFTYSMIGNYEFNSVQLQKKLASHVSAKI